MSIRKIFQLVVTMVLCCTLCGASLASGWSMEELDLTQATDEELVQLADLVRAEQRARLKTAITLDMTEVTLAKGKTQKITATVTDMEEGVKEGKFTWSTSDAAVATCSNGSIKAVDTGETVITCSNTLSDGTELFAECKVTVYIPVQSLTASEKKVSLHLRERHHFGVTVKPENATNPAVTYSSSDPAVAEVNENGRIIANGLGKATLTASATDGSEKTVTMEVTVAPIKGAIDSEITYHNIPWGSSRAEADELLSNEKASDDGDNNEMSEVETIKAKIQLIIDTLDAKGSDTSFYREMLAFTNDMYDEDIEILKQVWSDISPMAESEGIDVDQLDVTSAKDTVGTGRGITGSTDATQVDLFPLDLDNLMTADYMSPTRTYDIDQKQQVAYAIVSRSGNGSVMGHKVREIHYSFAYGVHDGQIDQNENHLFSVKIWFEWSNLNDFIDVMTKEFGAKPTKSTFRDALNTWTAYAWYGANDTAFVATAVGNQLDRIWYTSLPMSMDVRQMILENKAK